MHNNDSSDESDFEIDLELTEKEDDKEVEASAPAVDDEVTLELLRQDTLYNDIDND